MWKKERENESKRDKAFRKGEKGVVDLFKLQISSGDGTDSKPARFSLSLTAGVLNGTSYYSLWVKIQKSAVKSLISAVSGTKQDDGVVGRRVSGERTGQLAIKNQVCCRISGLWSFPEEGLSFQCGCAELIALFFFFFWPHHVACGILVP